MRTRGMQVRGIQRRTSDVTADRVACRVLGETELNHALEGDSTGEKVINRQRANDSGDNGPRRWTSLLGRPVVTGRAENLTES